MSPEERSLLWNPQALDPSQPLSPDLQVRYLDLEAPEGIALHVAQNHHLTSEASELALQHPSGLVSLAIHKNPYLPLGILERLLGKANLDNVVVLTNPSLPVEFQYKVVAERTSGEAKIMASNPNLHPDVQLLLWNKDDHTCPIAARRGLTNLKLHPQIVEDALQSADKWARQDLARNKHMEPTTLERLAQDTPEVLSNPNTPWHLVQDAFNRGEHLEEVAANPHLELDYQLRLATGDDELAKEALGRYSCHPEVLEKLYVEDAVRFEMPWNPNTPGHLLDKMVYDEDTSVGFRTWNHTNYRRGLSSPVALAHRHAPWILDMAAEDAGVAPGDIRDLAPTWRGSIQELLEAVRLTQR